MTPELALTNLDNATKVANANRETHQALVDSINTLQQVVREWQQFKSAAAQAAKAEPAPAPAA